MRWHFATWLTAAAFLGGCAAAVPGYVPPSAKRDRMLAAAPKGGGFDSDGNYHLTEQEQKLECKQLNGSITVKILQMREADERAKPSTAASTAQWATKPIMGGTTYGRDLERDHRQDRARLETLNQRLAEKDCRTFNLDAELRPGNTAQPAPVGEPPKNSKKKT